MFGDHRRWGDSMDGDSVAGTVLPMKPQVGLGMPAAHSGGMVVGLPAAARRLALYIIGTALGT